MSIFYCCLTKENTKRVYQFLKKGLGLKMDNNYQLQEVSFEGMVYTFCFKGQFINRKKGEAYLKQRQITYLDDKQYLLALYRYCQDDIRNYISDSSFLLVDDNSTVYIYSDDPLYYARKPKGEIYVSSERDYLNENIIFEVEKQCSLFFFNNNLKTLR